MYNNVKVALAFSTYNSSDYVLKCLLSCLKQDYIELVVIVADDGSSDDTIEIMKKVGTSYDNLYIMPLPHGERGIARITAIKKAKELKCSYIAVIDSDMVLKKNMVKDCIEYFNDNPEVGALVIPETAFSDYNNFISKVKVFERNIINNAGENWGKNSIEAARFWRMEAYESTGGFNPKQISFEEIQPSIRYFDNGGIIKRANFTGVYHDEKYVTLSNLLKKKKYYFSVMNNTLTTEKQGIKSALQRFYFFRPVLYRKENLIAYMKHPILTLGMIYMYILLSFIGVFEVLKSRFKR
ncbi:glycosyltransferase [Clostridium tetanomorphum]|uniref:Glycosyltransferase family 2 protein n=1 Tax=Clostridium tetanomorphum TaxID=1553 RepID=A0A923EAX4_CLOTT|nr:glycosyltransferase family 2 protein [Clostridium tetanomorphum]MBC2397008.1 glycosyltransferase family 2 protein [Clostridium tetanomorphum]NRZ99150.1 glycosyltransferase involved in cell wall biosynthesis [Clostridium tetanomorphum]